MNRVTVVLIIIIIIFIIISCVLQYHDYNWNSEENCFYVSDKYSSYYKDGVFYTVSSDGLVKKEYFDVIKQDESILEYLSGYDSFDYNSSEVKVYDSNGNEIVYDLSTNWESVTFEIAVVYWKYDNAGMLVTFQPNSVVIIDNYTDYDVLLEELGQ